MSTWLHRGEAWVQGRMPKGPIQRLALKRAEDLRFTMVGSIGFAVNFVALWLLHGQLGLGIFVAQLLSAELALLSNFAFHHSWTYQDYAHGNLPVRLVKFHATAWTGVLIGAVVVWFVTIHMHVFYLLALVVGAAVALFWNYTVNKKVIWTKRSTAN